MKQLSPRFQKGIAAIKSLEQYDRYKAAFIFGSVAEGTSNEKSDLDVKVIINEFNPCDNINHPIIDGYKLDITFISFNRFKVNCDAEVQNGDRQPNLASGVIVFDKTGKLTELQKKIKNTPPKHYDSKDYHNVQFFIYHANNKVERFMEDDPFSALYSMHANIGEVLKDYYRLTGHWWVSSKKVLADLEQWDSELAELVKKFVSEAAVKQKYGYWSAIIDHITKPMGGRQPISEINCDCEVCRTDLKALLHNL